MSQPTCNMCGRPATVEDTEYTEFYCDKHAREYEVYDGPHRFLDDPVEGFLTGLEAGGGTNMVDEDES